MQNALIAERIKLLCKENKITVKALLEQCDLQKGFIYKLEKLDQSPSTASLTKIADYLGCSVDYLLGRTQTQSVTIAEAHDNVGVVGQANAPVTIHNGHERQLTTQEKDLLKIYNSISGKQQTELMRFAYELEETE